MLLTEKRQSKITIFFLVNFGFLVFINISLANNLVKTPNVVSDKRKITKILYLIKIFIGNKTSTNV